MDNQSDQAKIRSSLFESITLRDGCELIPGRYGGDYNNDQLAIRKNGDSVILLLGLKLFDKSGETYLDKSSLGPFMQLSAPWLDALVQCLKIDSATTKFAEIIEHARREGQLVTGIACLNKETNDVQIIRIAA